MVHLFIIITFPYTMYKLYNVKDTCTNDHMYTKYKIDRAALRHYYIIKINPPNH